MVNSESRSPNDQVPPSTCSPHEDGCEEAVNKLAECMSTVPMMKEFGTKGLTEAFKAGAFHAEDNYLKGGACKESFMALAECPDRDKPDKQAAMLDCMEAHSDYYHKYIEIVDGHVVEKSEKELFAEAEISGLKCSLGNPELSSTTTSCLGKPHMVKSTVVDSQTGKSKDRRPLRALIIQGANKLRDKIIKTIAKRIADYTFIPADHGEGLQVLYYEEGQKYDPHYDYFVDEFNTKNGGQRMATMLMYLSDVDEGGETVFPTANMSFSSVPWYNELSECGKKGLSVTPRMGDALLFWSTTPDATLDPSSLYGGCPVIRGNKWSSTKWMHVGDEEETKHNAKTNTTTEVKDEESLMDGSDRADTGHVDNMVHSVEEPIIRKAILKGPISVRTRQVRG
ncbi:hypothetical protein F2Q70_00019765 [Brassica cretica]|uniref:procollagen-proline 4-dioxygenase n=1 Tax=Brassica cretica TaxID=69181 RepID=A0A8S9GV81_BRACR|nr:hypothetical protein F2Q70_00019765 [Brassica cretica]